MSAPPIENSQLLTKWIAHLFDHPATEPNWYFEEERLEWPGEPEEKVRLIAQTFENSGNLLAPFSDAQLDIGFWFLVSESASEYMINLVDPQVDRLLQLRALQSFVTVFIEVMAVRCSPHLGHLSESGPSPLNGSCYMWWDILPIKPEPNDLACREFDREVFSVMTKILAIPHDACRESALHGIGHWVRRYPPAALIIDHFLANTKDLRPELVEYAMNAKSGYVL